MKRAKQITCCCFDLETTNLAADFGVILCGVVKGAGEKPAIFRADQLNKDWPRRRSDDGAVLAAVVDELEKYDIWVAHNGARFDVPFLRTRLLAHESGPLVNRKLIDPVLLARNKLRLSFNSLDQVASHLGVNKKTPVTPKQWITAALDGSTEAMDYIVQHCIRDVYTLEHVVEALKAYSTTYNTYGSGF